MMTQDDSDKETRAPAPQPRGTPSRWSRAAHELLRPSVIIPTTLSIALLATLLGFGNVHKILTDITSFQPSYLLWYVLVMTLSICGRGLLWLVLIRAVGAHVPIRSQVLAFLVGEVTKSLPLGNYFPNYILNRSTPATFSLTAAATLTTTLLEVVVALVGVVVLGLGAWTNWLRPMILIGSSLFLLIIWGIYLLRGKVKARWTAARQRSQTLQRLGDEAERLHLGMSRLWRPRVVLIGLLICACYIGLTGGGLYLVARGLGLNAVTFQQALSAYCFSLAFALIEPSPVDLGVIEAGGVGAFLAIGVHVDLAISVMLIQRALSTGVSLAVAMIGIVVLRRDLRTVLHPQPA